MDNRERDARIAEWLGWKRLPEPWEWYDGITFRAITHAMPDGRLALLPRYSSNLNAMAEAERVVVGTRGEFALDYALELFYICTDYPSDKARTWTELDLLAVATATAAQRAEALCRVIDGEEA